MSVVEGQFGQMWHQVAGHKDHGDSPGNFVTFCHFQSVRGGFCSDSYSKCYMDLAAWINHVPLIIS